MLAGTLQPPAGFEVSGLSQAESARPFTITTPDSTQRVTAINQPTTLDEFRATPYIQTDLRVSRPFHLSPEGAQLVPQSLERYGLHRLRKTPFEGYGLQAVRKPIAKCGFRSR